MKLMISAVAVLILGALGFGQSGRRQKPPPPPTASPEPVVSAAPSKPQTQQAPQVTAEKNQDYRCTEDGTLARILDTENASSQGLSPKEVDTPAIVTVKPNPKSTS